MINVTNRSLYINDNLKVLRGINSESIDLIATDPPFNKGVKAFEGITKAGETVSYKDVWTWGDVQDEWVREIQEDHPSLYSIIQAANIAAGDDMGAFLCWLGVRVLAMHRILKPTGSLYLHCDHTASAYIKMMLDSIFGRENFRNQIVWGYRGMPSKARKFIQKHDTILFYSKSNDYTFNVQRDRPTEGSLKTFESAKRVGYNANHKRMMVTIFDEDKYRAAVESGKIPSGMRETHFNGTGGPPMKDWWEDIKILGGPKNKERTGYPTQKPLALYERIIKASSNENDIVLDPFAGCATTCVAAEKLNRQWIAIDINDKAADIIHERLHDEVEASGRWGYSVNILRGYPERTDDRETAAPELILLKGKSHKTRGFPRKQVKAKLVELYGLVCQGCGWEAPYEDYLQIDHKRPRSLGGDNSASNLTLLCGPCNRLKSNKRTLTELRAVRVEEGRADSDWYETAKWE